MAEQEIVTQGVNWLVLVITHISAIIVGVFSGLGTAWIRERAQTKREEAERDEKDKARKRELISSWRAMINRADGMPRMQEETSVEDALLRQSEFLSLEPLLSADVLRKLKDGRTFFVSGEVGILAPLNFVADEISRLEREWEL